MNQPHLYILAGPNGVGKTTYARRFLPAEVQCLEFINADMIAQGLSPLRAGPRHHPGGTHHADPYE